MNTTQRLIAATLFAAFGTGAFAQEATPDTWMNATASKSREQVQAELVQARKDGSSKSGAANYNFVAATAATKSREQVRAELIAARETGEYDVLNSEAHAFGVAPRSSAYAKAAK